MEDKWLLIELSFFYLSHRENTRQDMLSCYFKTGRFIYRRRGIDPRGVRRQSRPLNVQQTSIEAREDLRIKKNKILDFLWTIRRCNEVEECVSILRDAP
jgi:hypothetical protein